MTPNAAEYFGEDIAEFIDAADDGPAPPFDPTQLVTMLGRGDAKALAAA